VLVTGRNADEVGLRRAISDEEVERLFGRLGDGKIDDHQNWKGRFKDNSDKMRSGSIFDMADVLKSLTFLARSKSLSFREKRMLDRARALIVTEVSDVIREKTPVVEGRVDQALERCFTTKARLAERAAAARTKAKSAPVAVVARANASTPDGPCALRNGPSSQHVSSSAHSHRGPGTGTVTRAFVFLAKMRPWQPQSPPSARR
jgi:CarD family transcriptional regulator